MHRLKQFILFAILNKNNVRNDQVPFKALENSQIEKIRSTNQKRKTTTHSTQPIHTRASKLKI